MNSGRMDWQCGMHGGEENMEQDLEYLKEWPLRKPVLIWEDNTEMEFNDYGKITLPTVTLLVTFVPIFFKIIFPSCFFIFAFIEILHFS